MRAETIRSTVTDGGNGVRFTTTIKVVDDQDAVVSTLKGSSFFLDLDPNTYEEHNTLMKPFENGSNVSTTITNPDYNSLIDFKLVRTN